MHPSIRTARLERADGRWGRVAGGGGAAAATGAGATAAMGAATGSSEVVVAIRWSSRTNTIPFAMVFSRAQYARISRGDGGCNVEPEWAHSFRIAMKLSSELFSTVFELLVFAANRAHGSIIPNFFMKVPTCSALGLAPVSANLSASYTVSKHRSILFELEFVRIESTRSLRRLDERASWI